MLPQDLAQVNEENLPVYNRCALYALGAAYLNLISQLTTVPAFCQHIHEVGYKDFLHKGFLCLLSCFFSVAEI